jgi:hypothetical protein
MPKILSLILLCVMGIVGTIVVDIVDEYEFIEDKLYEREKEEYNIYNKIQNIIKNESLQSHFVGLKSIADEEYTNIKSKSKPIPIPYKKETNLESLCHNYHKIKPKNLT